MLSKLSEIFSNQKTIRKLTEYDQNTYRYSLHKKSQSTLGSNFSLSDAIKCPEGEEKMEWIIVVNFKIKNRMVFFNF
jgi:hypothetical protein